MVQGGLSSSIVEDKKQRESQIMPLSYLWPLRFILGFQFFTAWVRRYFNAPQKLDYYAQSNIGHKFQSFLPHALGPVKTIVGYLVLRPHLAWDFLIVFSWIECLVGLCLMTGTLTRLAALGGMLLSFGMLFGNGWQGTTCIDEFQIGTVEGIACMVFLFTGAGSGSFDHWIHKKWDGYIKIWRWFIHLT